MMSAPTAPTLEHSIDNVSYKNKHNVYYVFWNSNDYQICDSVGKIGMNIDASLTQPAILAFQLKPIV